MTLVLRSATLTDVSDRAAREIGQVRARTNVLSTGDVVADVQNIWANVDGNPAYLLDRPFTFNGSTWDRVRASLGGMLYQKPLPLYMNRAPRRITVSDDFEAATLKWAQIAGTVTRDTTAAGVFEGAASLKMVTGAVAGNAAQAEVLRGFRGQIKYVIELWWTMTAAASTTPRRFGFALQVLDGTNLKNLWVEYLKNLTTPQNKWQFSGDGTTFTDVTGGAETLAFVAGTPYVWHYLRAHLDFSLSPPQLTELHTDSLDLTGLTHAGATTANTASPEVTFFTDGTTDAAAAATYVVDEVVVSDSEA